MDFKTLLILFLQTLLLLANNPLYVVLGEAGAGKSSFINWLVGKPVAKVGHKRSSETKVTNVFEVEQNDFVFSLMDTPGFFDTDGLRSGDIVSLIEAELLRYDDNFLSGIVLLIDATSSRLRIKDQIVEIITFLGNKCLTQSTIVLVNKSKYLSHEEFYELKKELEDEFKSKGLEGDKIFFIDTKKPLKEYWNQLKTLMQNLTKNCNANFIQAQRQTIDEYYQQEINNQNNYQIEKISIPHTKIEKRSKIVYVQQSYSDERCYYFCLLIFTGCIKTSCEDVYKTRQVPKEESWEEPVITYTEETRKVLKNEPEFYALKARERYYEEIRMKVFSNSKKEKTEL